LNGEQDRAVGSSLLNGLEMINITVEIALVHVCMTLGGGHADNGPVGLMCELR
jgi:hypothetical protein